MLKKIVPILLVTSALISCQTHSDSQMISMDLDKVNSELLSTQKAKPLKVFSLISLLEESNYIIQNSGEISAKILKDNNNNSYHATVKNYKVPGDDSISGYMYVFTFKRSSNGFWVVSKAQESWSCWPNRGHQDFSIESCS